MHKEEALKIVRKIRDYMLSKKLKQIYLKEYMTGCDSLDKERILFNRTPSPDGTLGMFLLLRRSRFSIDKTKLNSLEKRVLKALIFDCDLEKVRNETRSSRLQDKFEEFTQAILKKEFGRNVLRVDRKHMSEYDFKIEYKSSCVTVEVKSDRWKHTGNISLELLRDYRRDYKQNIGSILKTEATFWQVYYYDKRSGDVSSELFLVSQLKCETYKVLDDLNRKLKLGAGKNGI